MREPGSRVRQQRVQFQRLVERNLDMEPPPLELREGPHSIRLPVTHPFTVPQNSAGPESGVSASYTEFAQSHSSSSS